MGELRGYGAILLASAAFGASATLGTLLLTGQGAVAPLAALIVAHGLSTLVFLPFARKVRFRREDAWFIVAWGVNGAAIAPALWFLGIAQSTVINAALLANMEALWTIAFAYVFLHERVPRRGYVGIAAILVGVLAVTTKFDLSDVEFSRYLIGNVLLILSSLSFGIDNNMSRVLVMKYDRRAIPFYKTVIGLAVLVPLALALGTSFTFDLNHFALAATLGLVGVAGVIWFFYIAFQEIGAMRAGAIISTSALFGVAFAFGVFGASPTPVQLGGGLLMVAGTFLTSEWMPNFRRKERVGRKL